MRLLLTAVLAALTAAVAPAAAFAAPANDDFADAEVITGATGTATGTNLDASKEAGEPDHAGNPGGHSIWYSWTAAEDGNLAITTSGSTFDTVLAVYTGGAVNSLTPVAANDDAGGDVDFGFGTSSTVSLAVSNGVTYIVAVDGFAGKVGFVELSWHPAPVNDNFADREVLPSTNSGNATGDVSGATLEAGEPRGFGESGTIWYSWTAPADGTYKFDTVGSSFDTVLAIYEGSDLSTLDSIGVNDDDPDRGCCSSWVPIRDATTGTTYSIAVSSLGGPEDLVLRWSPLVLGTAADEILVGTDGDEEIRGRGGDDILRGLGGSDMIFGGRGDDRGVGGDGDDRVFDRSGLDELRGRAGDDRLNARDSRSGDLLAGGAGADRCRGDGGDIRRSCA